MSVAAGVSDAAIAVRDKLRGKIGQTKVKRYWPGKKPEWADEAEDDIDLRAARVSLDEAFPKAEEGDRDRDRPPKDDRRLRRLAETRAENKEELRADHRRIRQAEIVSTAEEERDRQEAQVEEEDDEDAQEERRRRIKERQRLRAQEEEELLPQEDEPLEDDVQESEESEYETDSEDEQMGMAMVKPVFIPKAQRDTIAERERLEEEERQAEENIRKRLEARKIETRQIVVEEIRKDEHIQKALNEDASIEDVDTDDELNEAEEYESWKNREMARIKRDREERYARLKEKEEIDKVRNMTEEERREWEKKNPKPSLQKSKQKWNFMQKYYHKGAFFQEGGDDVSQSAGRDAIYTRDFSAPTGEDKMDKSILPKVMQVKHFGRSGRTKWTHLVNEDTTDWDAPWATNGPLRTKYNAKMAGMNAPIAKPKGSKKMKDWDTKRDD